MTRRTRRDRHDSYTPTPDLPIERLLEDPANLRNARRNAWDDDREEDHVRRSR